MKYLLDTDTLIDFIQNHGNTRNRIATLTEAGALIGLCAITIAELHSGISQKNSRLFSDWLKSLPYWDISREAAGQAGVDRKTAAEAGRTLHMSDCLIAACARERGAIVLTSNIRDFEKMKAIRLMSLREEAAQLPQASFLIRRYYPLPNTTLQHRLPSQKCISQSMFHNLTYIISFDTLLFNMATTEQKKNSLKPR